ncbi:response regulator transcription factor [Aliikangiella coralliicola]|uniref:Response regulator transcription factor n=1 Tax=Aliikangiella coralliicola TaxID=2592383 RepID=A0A545TW57_9GAMM|nr:response regulator transcription factor [Aliikangiella coralliicola]TQV81432.1 response regulator transcription factor [Aliikangiella coralliicola]
MRAGTLGKIAPVTAALNAVNYRYFAKLVMWRLILKYALILFAALSGFKFLEYQFFSHKMTLETYLVIIATIFLLLGFFVSRYFLLKASPADEPEIDLERLAEFSQREQEILLFLSHGYTNKEIAKSLDISPNTVKTHMSSLFGKLDVNNRTQAVAEAKSLRIIK